MNTVWMLGSISILSIVAVFLFVIANLARKTSIRPISGRFLNCLLTFFTTVGSENSIEFFIGLSGQLLLFLLFASNTVIFDYFAIYSLVFFGLWAIPVLKGLLTNLETIYIKAFKSKLAHRLQGMKKHYIIIGYGRYGKTVINELFENYVYLGPKFKSIYSEARFISWNFLKRKSELKLEEADKEGKPILLLERILNENCEDALLCTNLVVVDEEERLLSNVFPHPNFGKIGVFVLDKLDCLSYDEENYKKKIYIPAIVGDARNNSTLGLARIDKSKMVLSLIPEVATFLSEAQDILPPLKPSEERLKPIIREYRPIRDIKSFINILETGHWKKFEELEGKKK